MKVPVAILGATGAVGQRFVSLLADHPWFEVACLVGQSNVGTPYRRAASWLGDAPMPDQVADMRIAALEEAGRLPVAFSALPSGAAEAAESRLAASGVKVFTNARDHRMRPGVPMAIAEVNAETMAGLDPARGWIVANGNCTSIILSLALAPLQRAFGLKSVDVTSLQGLSGAGYPGVSALDVTDNVIPFIPGEEERVALETDWFLGRHDAKASQPAGIPISATCTRVAVREGHLLSVHARLGKDAPVGDLVGAWRAFRGSQGVQGLPSAPPQPILVHDAEDRPQPRRDRDLGNGMAVSVGRLRLDGRLARFVALGSNTVRGAAGGSLLNAEWAKSQGLLG